MKTVQNNPFFSIIIPTLNEEKYLPLLLKDLKNQTFVNFEVIVVDAMSTDKTQLIAKSYNVNLLISPKKNVSYQRNLGAKNTKGEYLIFFDADVRIPEYYFEGLKYRISISKPDFFTTWTGKDSNKRNDEIISSFINFIFETGKILDIPVVMGAMVSCHNKVFRKINGFDPSIKFGEDSDFTKRALKVGFKFNVFKDPKYTFSLRRFRKEGTLQSIRNYAKLHFLILTKGYKNNANTQKIYHMLGGTYYENKKKRSKLENIFEETLKKIKSKTNNKTLQQIIENLFSN